MLTLRSVKIKKKFVIAVLVQNLQQNKEGGGTGGQL